MGGVTARMRKSFVTKSAFKWFVARVDSYVLLKMKILCMEMSGSYSYLQQWFYSQQALYCITVPLNDA